MDLTRKRLERGYCSRPTNPQPRRREKLVRQRLNIENADATVGADNVWEA
jgi:hypothetical protein